MKSKLLRLIALSSVFGIAFLSGCGTFDQTYLPVRMSPVYIRVSAQQLAVSEAAKKAAATLNFSALAGKTVYVQVNGVFPHSHYNVLDYIQSLVEGRMALGGMIVKPTAYVSNFPAPAKKGADKSEDDDEDLDLVESVETLEVRHYNEVKDADYRAIVAVGAAGADFRTVSSPPESYYDGKVSMVVMLIPLNAKIKPLTLEATATAEHQVVGVDPAFYSDDN
jgi:hypothetical protein